MSYWHYANYESSISPADLVAQKTFTLTTSSPTDIWRKPPATDVFSAPIVYESFPISAFRRAKLTVTAQWRTLYDQGGIVIVLPPKAGGTQKRWIKAGIEFYLGKPFMSVVATNEWSDWSLLPLTGADAEEGKVTIEVERDTKVNGELGPVLRILVNSSDGGRVPIREVTWGFWGASKDSEEMWVGAFAAKPTPDERQEFEVQFSEFAIEIVTNTLS